MSAVGKFNREPLVAIAVAFVAGVVVAKYLSVGTNSSLVAALILSIAAFITRKHVAATMLILLAFGAAGVFSFAIENRRNSAPDRIRNIYDNSLIESGTPVEIEGVLARQPEAAYDGRFLTLHSDSLTDRGEERPVAGEVRVFVPESLEVSDLRSEISNLRYGSRVRIACQLTREDQYLNPGVISRIELLDRQGIDATCAVKSPLLIEHIADESVFLPIAWVYEQRSKLIDELRQNLSPRAAGVMIASLLGNKHFLDKDTAELFREGGTFHILVISGLHITFIGGILLLIVRRLTRNRWAQFVATTGTLWAYTLAVGADVPVVRAAMMFTVLLFGYVIYRSGSLLNSLAFSALVLLVWRPSDLFDASLQLTIVSVAAIVACAYPLIEKLRSIGAWTPKPDEPFPPNVYPWLGRLCETLYWNADAWAIDVKRQIWTAGLPRSASRLGNGVIQKVVRYVFEALLVSLIVQLWMLPLTVVYFHRVPLASIVLNLWVGLFIAIESFVVVAAVFASRASAAIAAPLFLFADVTNWLMLTLPRLFSWIDWASFRLPAYAGSGLTVYFLYLLPMLLMAVAVGRWRPFELTPKWPLGGRALTASIVGVSAVLAVVIVTHPFSAGRRGGRLQIDFLDVGQGDAALVTFPTGETMLVDGGGRFDHRRVDDGSELFEPDVRGIGESVVSAVLWSKGLSRIDYVVATHGDADHVQGLTDVVRNFAVETALFARLPADDTDLTELFAALDRRGVSIATVARGDVIHIGDAAVEVLYPMAADTNAPSGNNDSIVLRIVFGSRTFLLTGDIERAAETDLVRQGGTLLADVVKVAHHGSRTSSTSEFVDSTGARFAVVSVGRRSPFGHPHADVVERWQMAGANVITTGTHGMVTVSTDGNDLEIGRFKDDN